MPLYEYKCQTCGFRHERIERASEPKDGVCPECGGVSTRLIGTPALQFKGSGWYVTDYGKGNSSAALAKTEETKEAASSSSDDTKPKKETAAKDAPKAKAS